METDLVHLPMSTNSRIFINSSRPCYAHNSKDEQVKSQKAPACHREHHSQWIAVSSHILLFDDEDDRVEGKVID